MTPREERERWELENLSPYAAKSALSKGRLKPDDKCPVRTDFQRDRDRIVHSKCFRRLAHKTQVFIAPELDHYRTRLTHTLEVAQIARTIARGLKLNEDLTEAIALGHDLGHTPFGHAGEWALDEAYRKYDPKAHFRHHEQSLRVVDVLEKEGEGLNLTHEVRDGILNHAKGREDLKAEYTPEEGPSTLEGLAVKIADRIAYVNHDLDDAIRAGLVKEEDIPEECVKILGDTHAKRIGTVVVDIIENSRNMPALILSRRVVRAMNALKDFLFDRVYFVGPTAPQEVEKVKTVIHDLFDLYMRRPDLLPGWLRGIEREEARKVGERRALARVVCDYIAGMTDRYARNQFALHFVPRGWPGGPSVL